MTYIDAIGIFAPIVLFFIGIIATIIIERSNRK